MNTNVFIEQLIASQKRYFLTQETKSVEFRLRQLRKLRKSIDNHADELFDALWKDLHKCKEEAYLTEYNIVIGEIDDHIRNLRKWSKSLKVKTPLYLKPSRSYVRYEPYGVALIIAPWNYPFNLMFTPLVGAISAGCCAVLKASPYSVNTSAVMQKIIDDTFDNQYIAMVQGHREVNQKLLEQDFDFIFYTGSPDVGSVVMEAASKHLTPLVLELGGKSPCIVDRDSNLEFAARRIIWGKTVNAGQTCVAPDYLFVHQDVKDELIRKMISCVERFYGKEMQQSPCYCRMITDKAYRRVVSYLNDGHIIYGGCHDDEDRYIQLTLLDDVHPDASVMRHEIFGPVLPVMTFGDISDVIDFVNKRPKPLSFYYFGKNKTAKDILLRTSSGGVCFNDTLLHVANSFLPFGGVGNSGMGKYHSRESFLVFSNKRSVLKSSNKMDFMMKYPPYKKFETIKKLM